MPEGLEADEARLIIRAQDGDDEAFGQLYELFAPRVFRYLFARLSDRLDAEDLTEEVFLRVWQALPGYQQRGIPFSGFVFRVAHNALIDHFRRSRRSAPSLRLEESLVEAPQADPAGQLSDHAEQVRLRRLLASLQEDYRVVLSLRFLAELTPAETAQAMGRSEGAIRVLQHRALKALRNLIAGQK
ncbi:MAG: sigma-70 family RNA polymerase sigma factor [Anaerolineales bacterium]|nr:sigma-70 family RNA polymerase sigma factor [Anaerolineales bacterium]